MAELITAKEAINEFCQPATDEEMLKSLIKLKALTINRNASEGDNNFIIEAYIEKLKEYPRDAVLEVLNEASNENKFFPAWSELKKELDWKSSRRREAIATIERKINAKRYAEIKGTSLRVSEQSSA